MPHEPNSDEFRIKAQKRENRHKRFKRFADKHRDAAKAKDRDSPDDDAWAHKKKWRGSK